MEKVVKVPVGEQTWREGVRKYLAPVTEPAPPPDPFNQLCISATSQTFCFLLQFNPAESAPLSMYVCNCTCMHFTTVATN